jgi:thymidine kinase
LNQVSRAWPRDRPTGSVQRMPRLDMIVGPMYSGKSAELIRRVDLARRAKLAVRVLYPLRDTRAPERSISSRAGTQTEAIAVGTSEEILSYVDSTVDLVAIDEASFLDADLARIARTLLARPCWVVIAGLDLDFRGDPFGPVPQLLALADHVDKLSAVCAVCHDLNATRTQRLIDGEPAPDGAQIVVERSDDRVCYEARCIRCWEPPRGPDGGTQLPLTRFPTWP